MALQGAASRFARLTLQTAPFGDVASTARLVFQIGVDGHVLVVVALSGLNGAFAHGESFYFGAIAVGLSVPSSLKALALVGLVIAFNRVVQIDRLARLVELDHSVAEVAFRQLGGGHQDVVPAQHFIGLTGLVSISDEAESRFVFQ